MTPFRFPVSCPSNKKEKKVEIDNSMEVVTGWGKTLTIDWVYWQYAWEVVYSDAGTI
jgi:hypothetical protein